MLRLILLFTLLPLADLVLLVWIARHTDWTVTLAVIFVPGVVGAWLARHEGLRCLREAQARLLRGEMPGEPLLSGVLVLVAGALLITPGLLTDVLGFMLLVPPIRRIVSGLAMRRLKSRIVVFRAGPTRGNWDVDRIVDVRVEQPPDQGDPDESDRP
jgi:UPF0716 protein FxsA